eukprot:5861538-Prymnesium_polylepis.2
MAMHHRFAPHAMRLLTLTPTQHAARHNTRAERQPGPITVSRCRCVPPRAREGAKNHSLHPCIPVSSRAHALQGLRGASPLRRLFDR